MWSSARKNAPPRNWHGVHAKQRRMGAAVERGRGVRDAVAASDELRVLGRMGGWIAPTAGAAVGAAGARGADRR